jgi:transposase
MPSGQRSNRCCPSRRLIRTRSVVTGAELLTGCVFEGILIRLVTGCAWVDAERLLGRRVSDTTLRDRRDEWIAAGVFDRLADEAVAGYDRVIGLDLSECSVDGSQHKAPLGGEGNRPEPRRSG